MTNWQIPPTIDKIRLGFPPNCLFDWSNNNKDRKVNNKSIIEMVCVYLKLNPSPGLQLQAE